MKSWKNILVSPETPILDAIAVIDAGALQMALIVASDNLLLGTLSDGDIRRAILKGIPLGEPVSGIMNRHPTTASDHDSRESTLAIMKQTKLRHIPVINNGGCLVGLEMLDEIIRAPSRDNWVVIMAGGLGSRLSPLTDKIPKPLLKVGGRPILETILENFIEYGFSRFYLSLNYKSELIEEYFGDGSRWGAEIRYLREDRKLGTAGALGLLPESQDCPVLVMNGDVLTKVNFQQLLDFHQEHRAVATMCVREYDFQVPYGVVRVNQHRLVSIEEKPLQSFFVNAGIYVLGPEALELVPANEQFDMPDLFQKLLEKQMETAVFPIREYWLDIGRMDDFERAEGEFVKVFG